MDDAAPLSVWPCAQQPSRMQRRGRSVPESVAHPAKMLLKIARRAIGAYSAPGDVVLDPMRGIGTMLVEAMHLGRNAFGIEYEPRWAERSTSVVGADDRRRCAHRGGSPRAFSGEPDPE